MASLVVLLLLLLASLLTAAWTHRTLLAEQASAAGELRRVMAFEAAEAGLAWAQAMLNAGHPVGEDCRPGGGATPAPGFVARYLGDPDARGRYTPRRREPPDAAQPLQMLCARSAAGWSCSCPASGVPTMPGDPGPAAPAFLLHFEASGQPGSVKLLATGCERLARPCLPTAAADAGASVRLRLSLARLPALATPPAAPLTALGDIDAGSAALGLHNPDARSGGLAAHSGGAIAGTALRVDTVPGGVPLAALLPHDAALAALTPEQLFVRHFGMPATDWSRQPGASTLDCRGDCGAALHTLIRERVDPPRIHVAGDLQLDGALEIGSPARPLVLVVDGALRLHGPVRIHGLVKADSLRWDGAPPGSGALLRGAALLSRGYQGDAAADFVYDAALVQRMGLQQGPWLRVPGSWRDF